MAERRITRSGSKLKVQIGQPTIQELFSKKIKVSSVEVGQLNDTLNDAGQSSFVQVDENTANQESAASPPSPPARPIVIRVFGTQRQSTSNKLFPIFSNARVPLNSDPITPSEQPVIIDISQGDPEPVTQETPGPCDVLESRKKAVQSSAPQDGHSADNPIVLDSSPVKSTVKLPPFKLFESRSSGDKKRKDSLGDLHLEAPFPDKNFQHVRGPQSIATPIRTEIPFDRRVRTRIPTIIQGYSPPPFTRMIPPVSDAANIPQQIPAEHVQHYPAIRHMLATVGSSTNTTSQLWVDKWSPRFAERVLGNEVDTLYLRDWLKALEIRIKSAVSTNDISSHSKANVGKKRGVKRPRIRREVSKKRSIKRRKMFCEEGWIVSDGDTSEQETVGSGFEDRMGSFGDSLSDFDAYGYDEHPTPTPASDFDECETQMQPFEYPKPDFSSLSNTIILCGPSGCGKTAAVYACAAELDWEVFEAYPGVGRRSGASLDNLVGQVGKNHLVMKTQNTKAQHQSTALNGDGGPLSSFLSNRNQEPPNVRTSHFRPQEPSESGELDVMCEDGFGFLSYDHAATIGEEPNRQVRQSMILLEEADILYKDDVNFWPTVVNIIKECRRPVILTCNDLSLIPVQDLPVQTILYFTACPTPVIISYLQSLCLAEGLKIDRNTISKLNGMSIVPSLEQYRTSMRSDKYEGDLRRCIHELQFYLQFDCEHNAREGEDIARGNWHHILDCSAEWPIQEITSHDECLRYLRSIDRHMAVVSLVDSTFVAHVEDGADGYKNSADDEMGHTIVTSGLSTPAEFSFCKHDISIAQEALVCSCRMFACSSFAPLSERFSTRNPELDTSRVYHQSQIKDIAYRNLNMVGLPEARLFLDYEPFVRQAVYYDREEENAEFPSGGRQTRNSQRSKHVRWVGLEEYQRERLARTGFDLE